MIWAGITLTYLLGPYFFEGSVTQHTYLQMINEWLLPQMRAKGTANTIYFQQDGAPPHFALAVCNRLNEIFPDRWSGRSSLKYPAPIP